MWSDWSGLLCVSQWVTCLQRKLRGANNRFLEIYSFRSGTLLVIQELVGSYGLGNDDCDFDQRRDRQCVAEHAQVQDPAVTPARTDGSLSFMR